MKIKKGKFLTTLTGIAIMLVTSPTFVFATDTIGTAEVKTATDNIKNAITSIAMPLGGVLIFASIVLAALRMIASANNPNKRSDSIGALAWVCGGGVILGTSLIIAGIIINVATNSTGSLLGGG